MTTITVSDAKGLTAALSTVKAGDVIQLSAGNYGDVLIRGKVFAADVTITSKDPGNPATLHSLNVLNSGGINFVGIDVQYTPNASTATFSPAVKITDSFDITIKGGHISAGVAVSGVSADAAKLDSSGNVLGMYTGRGVSLYGSKDVTIDGVDISKVFKGITVSSSDNTTIKNSHIHDTRTSSIVAGDSENLVITGNRLSDAHPFKWGSIDHGDYIHILTAPNVQTGATKGITITNNTIEQGKGTALLGIYLDDNGNKLGFSNVTIANNTILNGNAQGVRLEYTFDSKVTGNVMLQTSGDHKDAPGIVITAGSHHVDVSGNIVDDIALTHGATANVHDNTLVQRDDPSAAGYYSSALVDKVDHMVDLTTLRSAIGSELSAMKVTAAVASTSFKLVGTVDTDIGFKAQAKSAMSQHVVGGRGDDQLVGMAGNDTLVAGAGNDRLAGNVGNDIMSGGLGSDTFIFDKNYPTTGGTDTIIDFSSAEGDKINVHSIDANINTAKGDDFKFIGTQSFHRVAGELRYGSEDGNAVVQGDINGDGVADFTIKLMGVTSLGPSDFIF